MSDPDREARDEALRSIGRRLAIVAIPAIVVGILVTALGVPLWITLIGLAFFVGVLLFEA